MPLEEQMFKTIKESLEINGITYEAELTTDLITDLHLENEDIEVLIADIEDEFGFIFIYDVIFDDIEMGTVSTIEDLIDDLLDQVDLEEYYAELNDSRDEGEDE